MTAVHVHNFRRRDPDEPVFICACGQTKTPHCLMPSVPDCPDSPLDGHPQVGEAHEAYLRTLRDDTGKHGLTYDEARGIFYRHTNMRGWMVAENLLHERIPNFPGIHSLDAYQWLMHKIFGLEPKTENPSVKRRVRIDKSHVQRTPDRKLHWYRKDYSDASNGR